MTARLDGLPADELRALIRGVLRDVLPAVIERGPGQVPAAAPPQLPATPRPQLPATPPPGVPAGVPQAAAVPQAATSPLMATGPEASSAAGGPSARQAGSGRPALARQVRLETDADVHQFALEIVRLADNPARRRDLLTGRLTFTLAGRAGDAVTTGEHRIETGAVTERVVQSAAKAGQRLVLGPKAVLTPLARDRALALGVPIERER